MTFSATKDEFSSMPEVVDGTDDLDVSTLPITARKCKVFFERLDDKETGGSRIDADHSTVRRGSVQQSMARE